MRNLILVVALFVGGTVAQSAFASEWVCEGTCHVTDASGTQFKSQEFFVKEADPIGALLNLRETCQKYMEKLDYRYWNIDEIAQYNTSATKIGSIVKNCVKN